MIEINSKIILFLISITTALVLSFFSILITTKLGFLDKPNIEKHKTHHVPVPLAGGIALFTSLVFVSAIYRFNFSPVSNIYLAIGFGIIFVTGLLDDIFIFSAAAKLIGQIIGSIFIILGGISTSIFGGTFLDWGFTLFWLVGIINAFNFLDGADGMILETGIILSGALIVFTQLSAQFELQTYVLSLFGILLGLLYFNIRPAKMFMGDSGSQTLGLLLAILTLQYNPLGHDRTSSWITPIVMMAMPIFDVTLVVYSRLRRHLPIYRSGLDHTYHRLLQHGLTDKLANTLITVLVFLSTILAYGALKANRIVAYLIFGGLIATSIYVIYLLDHKYQPKE
ncbi:undecaprenyl/decaprenyl-phosphate alpha-N-acetylglucosaminyl 1-phosphate transferase [bacterium]|nr:undecaprenyl/decaprenyl-phosphate alpha-N-acetylglucosaminyl 1-phosphate transferase [bacterium]